MTPTTEQTPTPGLVAYEDKPTAVNTALGITINLNPKEYATKAASLMVANWLSMDPRTAAWGPYLPIETNQGMGTPWTYSVPFRQIKMQCGLMIDPGLWYQALSMDTTPGKVGANVAAFIYEISLYATGQYVAGAF